MLPTTIKDNAKLMLPTTIKDNTKSRKKKNWRAGGGPQASLKRAELGTVARFS